MRSGTGSSACSSASGSTSPRARNPVAPGRGGPARDARCRVSAAADSASRRSASRSRERSPSVGYQRSARSQSRWPPERPTTATSPRAARSSRSSETLCGSRTKGPPPRAARSERSSRSRDWSGPAAAKLGEHVPAECAFRCEPLGRSRRAPHRAPARVAPHLRLEERQVLDRVDERVPLDERALIPEEAAELGPVVRAEAAPEHEELGALDAAGRVELEEAEAPHGVEHVGALPSRSCARTAIRRAWPSESSTGLASASSSACGRGTRGGRRA